MISNWYNFFPRNLPSVEACDSTLTLIPSNQTYSGVFDGVVEDGTSKVGVQLRMSRNGNAVEGSYFREGVCGKIFGEVKDEQLVFHWDWFHSSGRGVANQSGKEMSGTSGYSESADNAGRFLLSLRPQF